MHRDLEKKTFSVTYYLHVSHKKNKITHGLSGLLYESHFRDIIMMLDQGIDLV